MLGARRWVSRGCVRLHGPLNRAARFSQLVPQYGPRSRGSGRPHQRQQRILLARVLVALRVPLAEEGGAAGTVGRPQYRGARGFYGIRGGAA